MSTRVRARLIIGAIAAAALVALSTGAVTLPRLFGRAAGTSSAAQDAGAARRTAANAQWASSACTDILAWKNDIRRDGTSLNLGFGVVGRIQDATSATSRLLNQLSALGLPPASQSAQARAETEQLRSDVGSRARAIERDAGNVATGDLAAVGALIADVRGGQVLGAQIADELRRVVSVDLGLSLAETRACRALVGIPI